MQAHGFHRIPQYDHTGTLVFWGSPVTDLEAPFLSAHPVSHLLRLRPATFATFTRGIPTLRPDAPCRLACEGYHLRKRSAQLVGRGTAANRDRLLSLCFVAAARVAGLTASSTSGDGHLRTPRAADVAVCDERSPLCDLVSPEELLGATYRPSPRRHNVTAGQIVFSELRAVVRGIADEANKEREAVATFNGLTGCRRQLPRLGVLLNIAMTIVVLVMFVIVQATVAATWDQLCVTRVFANLLNNASAHDAGGSNQLAPVSELLQAAACALKHNSTGGGGTFGNSTPGDFNPGDLNVANFTPVPSPWMTLLETAKASCASPLGTLSPKQLDLFPSPVLGQVLNNGWVWVTFGMWASFMLCQLIIARSDYRFAVPIDRLHRAPCQSCLGCSVATDDACLLCDCGGACRPRRWTWHRMTIMERLGSFYSSLLTALMGIVVADVIIMAMDDISSSGIPVVLALLVAASLARLSVGIGFAAYWRRWKQKLHPLCWPPHGCYPLQRPFPAIQPANFTRIIATLLAIMAGALALGHALLACSIGLYYGVSWLGIPPAPPASSLTAIVERDEPLPFWVGSAVVVGALSGVAVTCCVLLARLACGFYAAGQRAAMVRSCLAMLLILWSTTWFVVSAVLMVMRSGGEPVSAVLAQEAVENALTQVFAFSLSYSLVPRFVIVFVRPGVHRYVLVNHRPPTPAFLDFIMTADTTSLRGKATPAMLAIVLLRLNRKAPDPTSLARHETRRATRATAAAPPRRLARRARAAAGVPAAAAAAAGGAAVVAIGPVPT